jgi:hypothetical protein
LKLVNIIFEFLKIIALMCIMINGRVGFTWFSSSWTLIYPRSQMYFVGTFILLECLRSPKVSDMTNENFAFQRKFWKLQVPLSP